MVIVAFNSIPKLAKLFRQKTGNIISQEDNYLKELPHKKSCNVY